MKPGMNNAAQNNWQSKLDNPGEFPGEARLDKAFAWNRLEERLEPTGNKKSNRWYWLAAALIPLLLTPLFLKHSPANHSTPTSSPALSTKLPAPKPSQVVLPNQTELRSQRSTARVQPKLKSNSATVRLQHAVPAPLAVLMPPGIAAPADSARPLAITRPASRQLKVVQVNELNAYPSTVIPTASNSDANGSPGKKTISNKSISGSLFNLNIPLKTN